MEETNVSAPGGLAHRLASDPSSRKRFLKMAGGVGTAGALGLFLAACGGSAEKQADNHIPPADDLGIVNYALLLEFLEVGFYEDVLASGLFAQSPLLKTIKLIHSNEQEHVDALASTVEQLGGTPVKDPKADFGEVINKGDKAVLALASTIENLGAAAYLAQAPKIQAPDILALALSIHSVEGRHAAALNSAAGLPFEVRGEPLQGSIPNGPFARPLDRDAVIKLLDPYLPKVANEVKEAPQ
ncbi:MAG: hypothetical protein QOG62_2407 [Thermoleophilaceae bacterium]|jgi:rubrerythrin|nr:hypothetical protein [Thermoleophilaceae bacterium]